MNTAESTDLPQLGVREERVVTAVLKFAHISDAVRELKLHRRTVERILRRPHVMAAYRARRAEIVRGVARELRVASVEAVAALRAILKDAQAPHAARVQAARVTLEMAIRASEHEELVERVDALERARGAPALPPTTEAH